MQHQSSTKRPRGTGSLFTVRDVAGREVYYGKWYIGTSQVKRRIGLKRPRGTRDGLTKTMAENRLRELRGEETEARPQTPATIAEAGERLLERLEGRVKPSTLEAYESYLRVHLGPFFGPAALDSITVPVVEAFVTRKRRDGKAAKSIENWLGFLGSIFEFALEPEVRLATENPVPRVAKPRDLANPDDIHFLIPEEVEALVRAAPDDPLGQMERVLYYTAAWTGLRQGELVGLRWRDIDWKARKIRVRQAYVRGEYTTPKTKGSSRTVPLGDGVAGALDRHYQASAYQGDDDLAFAHPLTGRPFDRSKLRKRFKRTLLRAGVHEITFHDLRHTFGTQMAAAGVPLGTVQAWMGHSKIETTMIYAHYQESAHEADMVDRAIAGTKQVLERENLSEPEVTSPALTGTSEA